MKEANLTIETEALSRHPTDFSEIEEVMSFASNWSSVHTLLFKEKKKS